MKKSIVKHIKCSLITAAVFMGSVSVFAYTLPSGTYYFDNTNTKWSKVYIRLGSTGWCVPYEMKKVDGNANIYSYTFTSNQDNMSGLQFASTSGYNATSDCNNDCGLYNGNVISAGNKTTYHDNGTWSTSTPMYVAGYNNDSNGRRNMTINHPCPNSVGHDVSLDSKAATGSTIGYFEPSAKVSLAASSVLGYSPAYAATNDNIHATLNYGLQGTINSQLSLSKDGDHTKTGSVNVTLPSTPGSYTLKTYIKCVEKASSTYSSTYHIVGMTGKDLNFGGVSLGSSQTLEEALSDVWNGNSTCTVDAAISGGDASMFKFSSTNNQACSIAVSSKKGSVNIVFTPTGEAGDKTTTLTLTLTYNSSETVVKNYTLTGRLKDNTVKVIKGAEAVISGTTTTERATLSGYLQSMGSCSNSITERGVYYHTSEFAKDAYASATKLTDSNTNAITTGAEWSVTTTASLTNNTTYYYRPYVKVGDDVYCYGGDNCYQFRTGSTNCNYDFSGDTIYVTLDNSMASDDVCALKYRNFTTAISAVTGNTSLYDSDTKNLLKNIVFQVVPTNTDYAGTTTSNISGGNETDSQYMIELSNINNSDSYDKKLVIRSTLKQKPTLQHLTIRQSKNIEVHNVRITGRDNLKYTNGYDNAVDIDNASKDWLNLTCGAVADANILFTDCYITSKGFTCIHVSAYEGVTFEDCDIDAELDKTMKSDANTVCWGASAKFVMCKGIKFLRNNFRGSHTTSIWVQGVIGMLVMNNVFWNSNDSYNATYKENTSLIRLITQKDDYDYNENLGFFYNTFYVADNDGVSTNRHIDFFRLGRNYEHNKVTLNDNLDQNDYETIRFFYNNCYSYDIHSVIGANTTGDHKWYLSTTESDWCSSLNYNNFWSQYDENNNNTTSVFAIPTCDCAGDRFQRYINVAELVCSTGATDPGSLVLKGGSLNVGKHIDAASDVSGLGADELYNDRLHPSNGNDAVRRTEGGWTLGAYQQSENLTPVDEIIWWGEAGDGDWDNRNNWRKLDGTRVTCVDNFSPDLKVIIPAPTGSKYELPEGGIKTYPVMPTKFDPTGDRVDLKAETVNASQGIDSRPVKFADAIEIEYGASIKNIGALYDNSTRRYSEVSNHLIAGRDEWILVGTVVRKFDEENPGNVRLLRSEDFYLYKWPHVYMHQASTTDDGTVSWQIPFADLDESVPYDKVFAIRIPDQYGPYKFPAAWVGAGDDATSKKEYTFNGWFLNDDKAPEYKTKGANIAMLLCNTYPANIDIATAINSTHNNGSIKYYDYDTKNFTPYVSGDKEIKSGNGFLFTPNGSNDGWFRISLDMLTNSSTKYKSAAAHNPYYMIKALNASGAGGSVAAIVYDFLKDDEFDPDKDLINTTIEGTSTQPEIYVTMYNHDLDKVIVPDLSQPIPLGLVVGRNMTVEFSKYEAEGVEKAVLVDTEENKEYDITSETASITLAQGVYSDRFYLNLMLEDEVITPVEEQRADSADDSASGDIRISSLGKEVTITSTQGVILQKVHVTDMAGHTVSAVLTDDHFNKLNINVESGVYVINVVGDTMSKTEKVIIK